MHHLLAFRELMGRGLSAAEGLASLLFSSWAIRRALGCDHPLDLTGRAVRWVAVIAFLGGATYFPAASAGRVALGLPGVAFLAWPNFAHHLTRFLRRCNVLPAARRPAPEEPPSAPLDKSDLLGLRGSPRE